MITLSPKELRRAADITERIQKLQRELNSLLGAAPETTTEAPRKRGMSAAGRKAISAAAKARWAAIKAGKGKAPKRKMSAAGRKAIAAATKARWAKIKATGKKKL